MTSWMKERDRLMAQTLAFVQGVTGAQPETAATAAGVKTPTPDIRTGSTVTDTQPRNTATDWPAAPSHGDAPHLAAHPVEPAGAKQIEQSAAIAGSAVNIPSGPSAPATLQRVPLPDTAAVRPMQAPQRQIPLTGESERDDIIKRVDAFRARQSRIGRDRESYYDKMYAKIRRKLGNDDSDSALP